MSKTDIRREAALRIAETSRLLRSLVEHRLRPFGMSRVQMACLSKLDRQDGLVQAELADMLEIQPIAMVRLADQLAEDGLVERKPDPQDRRCNRLHITPQGRAALAGLEDFKTGLGEEVFRGISQSALESMLATLGTLHNNVKASLSEEAAHKSRKVSVA
ncbi:MAG: MarR family transcriptional regulator [Hyphomicrobiales bacterium]